VLLFSVVSDRIFAVTVLSFRPLKMKGFGSQSECEVDKVKLNMLVEYFACSGFLSHFQSPCTLRNQMECYELQECPVSILGHNLHTNFMELLSV
jgi:hypothetical protein